MNASTSHSRRNFLKGIGSLTIAIPFLHGCWPIKAENAITPDLPGSLRRTPQINAWLEVLEDGRVRIFSGKVELGQGIRIAIHQVAAEELDMDLDKVEVILAETGKTPNEGYTAGSGSIQNSAMAVRYAAASARKQLLTLASKKLQISPDELTLANGIIRTKDGKKSLSFYDTLAGQQLTGEVSLPVILKNKEAYRYVGKAISRRDLDKMVRGEALYVQDLSFPEMVYASVLRPKNYQSKLEQFDEEGLKTTVDGVLKVVANGSFLGVIAKSTWHAQKAIRYLEKNSEWSVPNFLPSQKDLAKHIKKIAEPAKTVKEAGNIDTVQTNPTAKASFFKPYIMHNSIGPAAAVVLWDEEVLHIWTNSQGIYPLREALKSMLNMTSEQIHVISVPGPGSFGHTVADDAAADAALLALAYPGKHIKVQWSRADENAWEPYGSAMIMEMEAGLDEAGKINFWHSQVWTDSHSTRPNKYAGTLLAARHLENPIPLETRGYLNGGHRNADPYYNIPNMKVDAYFFDGPLRVSSLRSLAAYSNIFAIESLMDMMAIKAKKDPLEFRLAHLEDERAADVIKRIQALTSEEVLKKNEGLGYAFARYKNTAAYCAMAAKVEVDTTIGKVKIIKMWAAIDVGEVINPDGLRNQTEGGMVQAASWTMMEEVKFDDTAVTSLNWATYPIFRYGDTPDLEVEIINRPNESVMGGGEASVPPVGAVITNAIFDACGKRIYRLPVKREDLRS